MKLIIKEQFKGEAKRRDTSEHAEMSDSEEKDFPVAPQGSRRTGWEPTMGSLSATVRRLDSVPMTRGSFRRLLSKRTTPSLLCFGRTLKLRLENR